MKENCKGLIYYGGLEKSKYDEVKKKLKELKKQDLKKED